MATRRAPVPGPISRPSVHPLSFKDYPAAAPELKKYDNVGVVGKGSFGVIHKMRRKADGKEFAMKELDYSRMPDKDRRQLQAEVAILDSLKHHNIVRLIHKLSDPAAQKVYIVMEYCPNGDLSGMIHNAHKSGRPLPEDTIWSVFLQLTLALHHCHYPADRSHDDVACMSGAKPVHGRREQVLHRDLKPENVFVAGEYVKLGDFGLSKNMGAAAFTSTYVGTPLYMPPEILQENQYDTKSDIWSLGCLVFEMCALVSPFSTASTQAELLSMVKSGRLPSLPGHISPALKSVVKNMLQLNPAKRPTTVDLLATDEMKLHKKLLSVQNQSNLLVARKQSIERHLKERTAALDAREAAVAAAEAELLQRQQRMDAATEDLREQYNQMQAAYKEQMEKVMAEREAVARKATAAAAARPVLEARATMPAQTLPRAPRHPAYEDTPSKIPFAAASPAPLNTRPLRRTSTKSLSNIAATAAAQAHELTPAKQLGPRASVGSPRDFKVAYYEDTTMASPAPSMLASPAPGFVPRPRRSSTTGAPEQAHSLIPAPAFVYREAATPAKWKPEDDDAPSPFIKRVNPRQPLAERQAPPPPQHFIPRSKSGGGLHAMVLKNNAGAGQKRISSTEGARARAAAAGTEAARVLQA